MNFWADNFRLFDRKVVDGFGGQGEDEELTAIEHGSFLDDARKGELRPVSWIDPNFVDLSFFERNSNDDHPPSDVRAAQELVLQILRALIESPRSQWQKTLFVITYDEHGGFYDHVMPPEVDDDSNFDRLGVRVPSFVISPWVEPGSVCDMTFDHTTLMRTILERFAPEAVRDGDLGTRMPQAKHLGHVLRDFPAAPGDYSEAVQAIANWRATAAGNDAAESPVPEEGKEPPPLRGFPAEMLKSAQHLRGEFNLPAGRP
jgi:phospholipase C